LKTHKDDTIWLENKDFEGIGTGTLTKPLMMKADAFFLGKLWLARRSEDRDAHEQAGAEPVGLLCDLEQHPFTLNHQDNDALGGLGEDELLGGKDVFVCGQRRAKLLPGLPGF